MQWLYLLLPVAALAVAFKTTSVAVLLVCLLASLGLGLAFILKVLAQRVESQSRDTWLMLDRTELPPLREQPEPRRAAGAPPTPPAAP